MVVDSKREIELIGRVWTSPEIYANLEALCDLGSRFTGSESARNARDFILGKFEGYGLQNTRLATFDYLGWTRGGAKVCIVAPVSDTLRSAISLVYSPGTPADGLLAEVIDVGMGTRAEYAAKGDEIEGRFVLTSSDSPREGPRVHRREKVGRAVSGGAAGFLFANHLPGLLAPTGSLRAGELATIPGVGLSYEDGFRIRRALRGQEPVELDMRLTNQIGPSEFSHVIGEVVGANGADDEVVVVGAHYDGHDISQGAVDNGSGTALVMELARLFAPLSGQLRRTVRFETYAAEEIGVYGSTRYVNGMGDSDVTEMAFMLNLDGGALSGDRGLVLQGLSELHPVFAAFAREMGYHLSLSDKVSTASDHYPYFLRGVPCASLVGNRPLSLGRGFGHTGADTLDKVSEVELRESAMVAARLLLRLANHPRAIGRRRTPAEIKQILQDHDLEEPLKAQGNWPSD